MKKTIPEDLLNLALNYCSRRETSRLKLTRYLKRKMPDYAENISALLDELEHRKIIDQDRYTGILLREYTRRGKGKRYIQQKLKEKGLAEESKKIEFVQNEELERATQVAIREFEKIRSRTSEIDFQVKQKVLRRLVGQGFEYSIAKKAVNEAGRTEE